MSINYTKFPQIDQGMLQIIIIISTFYLGPLISYHQQRYLNSNKFNIKMTLSPNFQRIDETFSIDGGLSTPEQLNALKSECKNVLYLCMDANGDEGTPGGFEGLKSAAFPNALHTPFSPSMYADVADKKSVCIQMYYQYEAAINLLNCPTAVVCRSAARASAVVAAYNGVKSKLTVDEVTQKATAASLKYLKNDALVLWVNTVVETVNAARASKLIFRQVPSL